MDCYIWYSKEGPERAAAPPSPLTVPNVTAHPSTASVPITVLLYGGGPLLCGFNVATKGLINSSECKLDGVMILPIAHHRTFMMRLLQKGHRCITDYRVNTE